MTPPSTVILDSDLKMDIQSAIEQRSQLKALYPESYLYHKHDSELDELYRDIGWQLVWIFEGGRV